jgi:hypothetical protein
MDQQSPTRTHARADQLTWRSHMRQVCPKNISLRKNAAPRTKAGLASVGKPCDHAIKDIDVMTCGEPASETSPKKMDRGARGASSVITCASSATNWDMILTCTGIYNYMASKRQKLASVRSHHFVL